ncbi:hypothetical protein DM02DRAFT_733225 [Periconia macrospinosa]|uniref:Uncharacterized protein n=1 Tax=Periconia macrospinosa TaxID=97972 RepID=A0A2V1D5K9_9PLEO|nr:hypothetical protein DM02DRAFT_733225 [Periconia macrospinosa]
MQFTTTLLTSFLLATLASAIPFTGTLDARQEIKKNLVCEKSVDDGFGNTFKQACQQGTAGCVCRNSFTQTRCSRVLEDGTGNTQIQQCSQAEEGQNGCECGETFATKEIERCVRVVADGTGNTEIQECPKSEEGKDDCECSKTIAPVTG